MMPGAQMTGLATAATLHQRRHGSHTGCIIGTTELCEGCALMSAGPNRVRKTFGFATMGLLVFLGAVTAVGYFGQRSLIYQPDTTSPGMPSDWGYRGREVLLHTTDDLVLTAWLMEPADGISDTAVLFAPGNAGNRGIRGGLAERIADSGHTVLLLEYRGYGGNPGSPSKEGLMRDAEAAVSWLNAAGFADDHLIYVGESLGTGVVVELALHRPPAAILLRSPFTRLADIAKRWLPFLPLSLLIRDEFNTLEHITNVTAPVTVMAGDQDQVVPIELSQAVAEAVPNLYEYIVLPGIGHNAPQWLGTDVVAAVGQLTRHAMGG